MNNPITVRIKSDIGITDEQKNELREKLVYVFIEQLRKSGMYKVTEGKNGNVWILRADLILPKKYKAEPVNGWISVKDRLPEYDKTVLVVNEDGYMHTAVRIKGSIARIDEWQIKFGVYFIDNDVWEEDEQGKITHWQPLPEPPKGGRL
jgi:hypothetical protein